MAHGFFVQVQIWKKIEISCRNYLIGMAFERIERKDADLASLSCLLLFCNTCLHFIITSIQTQKSSKQQKRNGIVKSCP
jgi:hypothetical protein